MLGYYKWLIHLLWQVFARGLIERGSAGAIVNISSQASQRALTNHYRGLMHAVLGHYKWLMHLLWQVFAQGLIECGSAGAILNISSQASQRALTNHYRGLMHAVLCCYKWLIHLLWQVFARGLIERGSAGAIVNISSQASQRALTNHYRGLTHAVLGYYKWLIHLLWQVFARGLIERGSAGAIVNISSQASQRALTNHIVYCMSKSAVDQLTRCLAFELGPHKVTLLQILANNYTINRFSLIE